MRTPPTLAWLFAATVCLCAAPSPAAEVILDRTAYWRYHFTARPIPINDGLPWDSRTTAAPSGWEGPDFDDSGWTQQRCAFPLEPRLTDALSGRWGAWGSGIDNVYIACFRSAFEVADPAGVTELTLSIAYHGGVRVFLNGHEVGRRHLPERKLEPGDYAFADDYPLAAYTCNPGLRLRSWRVHSFVLRHSALSRGAPGAARIAVRRPGGPR